MGGRQEGEIIREPHWGQGDSITNETKKAPEGLCE